MAGVPATDPIFQSKCKAFSALFPYAAHQARGGDRGMFDVILNVALTSTSWGFMWQSIDPYITSLFDESNPPHLHQAVILASPCADWDSWRYTPNAVARWSAAVLATPYSEEIGRNVVDALLQIASNKTLRPHIPAKIWEWLKRRPSLPPVSRGRQRGIAAGLVYQIQGFKKIEILKSYLLLVWSEWEFVNQIICMMMRSVIREEFSGIAMQRHREDLIERLNHILGQLDQGLEYFKQRQPQTSEHDIERRTRNYGVLKEMLENMGSPSVCLH